MQKLSFLILILICEFNFAQSPHGRDFDIDCQECHSTNNWKIDYKKLKFDHSLTDFELIGQHEVLDCSNCHNTIVFSKVEVECAGCHTDIHQNTLDVNCAQCHTSESWLVKNIYEIHSIGRFPLEGNHRLADCKSCHTSSNNLTFEPLGVECVDCHLTDYQSAKRPDHISAGFSTECYDCHQMTDNSWGKANLLHEFFPLEGGHQISNCFDCHSQSTFKGLDTDCYSCHQNQFNSASNPNHITAGFSTDCLQCHTTNLNWQPATFKSHDNFFQLVGAHKVIENDCSKCHEGNYTNTPNQCYDCHKTNYDNTSNPNHVSAAFGVDCESCHNSNAWQPANFDHDNEFFPIYSGEHNGEWNDCSDCHTNQSNYQLFECITCHEHNQNEMNNEHNDVNGYVYESNSCYACHPTGRGEGGFNHATSSFPLSGAHTSTECQDCHTSGYTGTPIDCNSCHSNDFQNSINPNHSQLGLDQNCEQCHTSNPDWQPASFSVHNDFYLIEGAHVSISNDCNSCHTGDYVDTKNLCFDCHTSDYNNATDPNHQSAGFGNECETCHSQNAWVPGTFDHDDQFFPIYSGSHNNEWSECSDCHQSSLNYQQFDCISCHEHNQSEMDSKHQEVQGYIYLSAECYACHPSGNGEGAFNHSISSFPLVGAHVSQECNNCHINGYTNTSSECSTCHQSNFESSVDPNHSKAGISILCEDCHNSTAWKPSSFDHITTGFELAGGHSTPKCSDCHSVNTANALPECFSCHENNYNQAADHSSMSYPKTCQDCHNINNWEETDFDHSNTQFALTGAHSEARCNTCHETSFAGTSSICNDCHINEYNSSSNPNHSKLLLSNNCEDCHTTNINWEPASFSVHNDFYVLQGAHSSISNDCNSCHNGDYNSGKNLCYDCHQFDFNNTNDPQHSNSGFGTVCEDCHSQNGWTPSTFDHDDQFFPIYSGKHREKWNNCADCHTNQNDYSLFSCIDCHEHNKTSMDDKHSGRRDYVYDSNACYDCHPNGSENNLLQIWPKNMREVR